LYEKDALPYAAGAGRTMRILIVEDEPRLLRILAKAFREESYAVDTAAAGDDGLYKAESYDYDAIVLDVMLPRLAAG
jgi:two-component system OmpR family response regulator